MKKQVNIHFLIPLLVAVLPLLFCGVTWAGHTGVDGIVGQTEFNFTVKDGFITTVDGGNYLIWGYSDDGGHNNGSAQYPGPTIIVNQGQTVTVNLKNGLSDPATTQPVSMIFPGQENVTASGGSAGEITQESTGLSDTVTYTFVASRPGTFTYQSGTNMALQVEMGLVGALIVRPAMGENYAYNSAETAWDREYLFLLSDMDPRVHEAVEFGNLVQAREYLTDRFTAYWFINGRVAPDTMSEAFVPWLPTQPYNIVPRMHPGERLLMRVIGGGYELHPYHHHGNHATVIAKDGHLLARGGSADPDLAQSGFTIQSVPGQTVDAIFEWTGKGMGWDIYGTPADDRPEHLCKDVINNETNAAGADGFADPDADYPYEYCADHDKVFPTVLPEKQDLAFGGWYSGSPFLGAAGDLPPGEGGLNPYGGFSYMWHSHTEKELTNFDIFPGGMLTMLIIEAWNVELP